MSARNSINRNLAASWSAHLVMLLTGLYLMPYVLGILGDEAYGTWLFINSVAAYSGLMYFGFGSTLGRYVSRHFARQEWLELNRIINVVFFVYLAMSVVVLAVTAVLMFLGPALGDWGDIPAMEVRLTILVLGINVAIGLVGSVFGGILMGTERFDAERGIIVLAALLRLGLTIALLRAESGLLTLALIFLAITLFENAAHAVLAFRLVPALRLRWSAFDPQTLKNTASFSTFAFIDSIAGQLVHATDTIVIGVLLGSEAIVPYFIALRLSQLITRPIEQIGLVSLPRAGALHAVENARDLEKLLVRGCGLAFLLIFSFLIGATFFGDAVIRTWVGTGYDTSYLLLLVLLGAHVVAVPMGVLRHILIGTGHVRLPALIFFGEAAANLVLSLLLIAPLGVLGVALGTAIPVWIAELGLLLPYGIRVLNLRPGRIVRQTILPQLAPLAVVLAYAWLISTCWPPPSGWFGLGLVALGGGTALLAGLLMFGSSELAEKIRRYRFRPTATADPT